jgi:hypothetical protein
MPQQARSAATIEAIYTATIQVLLADGVARLTTTRVALPAWIIAWRYDGTAYRCVVDGRDASVVIGDAPWSKQRVVGALAGVVAVAAVIAWALGR